MLCDVSHRPLPNPQQGGLSLHGQLTFIAIHLNAPVHPHEAFRHPVQRPLQGGFTERCRLQRRNHGAGLGEIIRRGVPRQFHVFEHLGFLRRGEGGLFYFLLPHPQQHLDGGQALG